MATTSITAAEADLDGGVAGAGPSYLALRLSVLIFLAFAVMGAWVPVFSLHLKNLGFSAEATAWASSTNALGAILAPLIWGQIADRWLAMERCLGLCAFVTAGLLWCLAGLDEPTAVFFVSLLLWFFHLPVISLTGAFVFRLLEHPERDYGRIRLWGTVGWVAASWCLTFWFAGSASIDFADSLKLGALAALAVGVYAWTLPHAPPSPMALAASRTSWLARIADAPLTALKLFRNRSFLVYTACMFGLYITMPFTLQLNPLLLKDLGVPAEWVPISLTSAHPTEIAALAFLPLLLARFGAKTTMIVGAASCAIGFMLLGLSDSLPVVLAGMATQGIFICCFVISGQVFINRHASHDIRASVQGILVLVNGSGLFLGHLLVGQLRDWTGDRYQIAYQVAAFLACGLVVLFALGFTGKAPVVSRTESLVPEPEMT